MSAERERLARRGLVSVALVALRGVAVRTIGLIGLVIVARMLGPHDFGLVTVGTAIALSAAFLADAGLGAGLIRRAQPPSRSDLQATAALQLASTFVFAALVCLVALPFGRVGQLTAVMVAPLPLLAFRTPAVVVLERDLRYGPIAAIELAETLAFYGWAVGSVVAGLGVWGYASAALVRAVAGLLAVAAWSPTRIVMPSLDLRRMRELLSFGLRYQAVTAAQTVRDQGLNLGAAALGGVATLGLWTIAMRLLQVPFLLFTSLWRVSFPLMAQLIKTGGQMRCLLERTAHLAALGTGLMLAPLAGAAPALVPALFGPQWAAAADALPPLAAGLLISGPISVAVAGYLYAEGHAGAVLRSSVLACVVWLGLALPLIGSLGVLALGIGGLAGALAEAFVLARAARDVAGADVVRPVLRPAAAGLAAGSVGWLAASGWGETALAAAGSAGLSALVYVVLLPLVDRGAMPAVRATAARVLGRMSPAPAAQGAP